MIKNILLLIVNILFIFQIALSQCFPDVSLTQGGVYPNTIPRIIMKEDFRQVFTIVVPVDTIVDVNGFIIHIPIDSVGLDSVKGLPPGIIFSSNSVSNYWKGGTSGCFQIEGICEQPGVYNMKLFVGGYTSINIPPYGNHISSINQYVIYVDDISQFIVKQNYPNPVSYSETTTINYVCVKNQEVTFCLYDFYGRVIYTENIPSIMGGNLYLFKQQKNLSLKQGVYLYTIDDGFTKITRKMFIKG